MERRGSQSDFRPPVRAFSAILSVVTVFPVLALAQGQPVELAALKQLLPESTHGTWALKAGPAGTLYVLNRSVPTSAVWVTDYSGSAGRMIVSAAENPELRTPRDLAVDRDGNVIVLNGDSRIKIFSGDGKLLTSFQAERPHAVAVLSDGALLASGFPKEHLISVFNREGKLIRELGEPLNVETKDPFDRRIMNMGSIVVDAEDNIYYVFRNLLTPIVRKYTADGKLAAEWRVESSGLDSVLAQASKRSQEGQGSGGHFAIAVLTSAAFDNDTKTLWIASGQHVLQLDNSGHTIRSLLLTAPDGRPIEALGLAVSGDSLCAAGPHGTFEFLKPR